MPLIPIALKQADREPNAHWCFIGDMRILFSYETPVAFERGSVRCVSKMRVTKTTRRQLSRLCAKWPAQEHDELLRLIADNLLVIIKDLKGGYDIVHESRQYNTILTDLVDMLGALDDQDWDDVGRLKQAVDQVHSAALAAMLNLTGTRGDPKVLFSTTSSGILLKALVDRVAAGKLVPNPAVSR